MFLSFSWSLMIPLSLYPCFCLFVRNFNENRPLSLPPKSHSLGLFFSPHTHFSGLVSACSKGPFPILRPGILRAPLFYMLLIGKHFNYTSYCESHSFRIHKGHKNMLCLWLKYLQLHFNNSCLNQQMHWTKPTIFEKSSFFFYC